MKVEQHYENSYRKEIVASLATNIRKGCPTTVVSVHGSGLAPLFKFLRFHPYVRNKYLENKNVFFSLINLEEMVPIDEKLIYREMFRDLKEILLSNAVKYSEEVQSIYQNGIQSEKEDDVTYSMKNLLRIAMEVDINIVFLFQEFDEIAKLNPPFLNTLVSLYHLFKPNLVYIYGIHTFPFRLRSTEVTKFDFIFQDYLTLKPFEEVAFVTHYQTHFAEDGLKFNAKQLKLLFKYTGGLASYNRFIGSKLAQTDIYKLEDNIKKLIMDPQLQMRSRQLLWALNPIETHTLKSLAKGFEVSQESLKNLIELGLVTQDGQIFSEIFQKHLEAEQDNTLGIQVEKSSKKVTIDNLDISSSLSSTEYRFLEFLHESKGQLVDREDVVDNAWEGNPQGVSDEAVDQLVSRLRTKLSNVTGRNDLITTVRGRGFILK